MFGDESAQIDHARVFLVFRSLIAQALYDDRDVVADSTAIHRENVAQLATIGQFYNARILIVEVRPSLETCKARNASRSRVVPEDVIDRMYTALITQNDVERFPRGSVVDWVLSNGTRLSVPRI